MDISALPYRPCVGIMLINPAGLVFVGQRLDNLVEAWQMPQGGIDKGEEPAEAAFRELGEETGTTKAEIIAESADWLTYDLPAELVPQVWKGRYRGQRQKWYAMRFTGTDADINIETRHPEFAAWRWAPHRDLPGLIVPFKRALYEAVVAEFAPLFAA
ncbi:RNA pyrophosphohydrolase [Zavarzinia compransoris]|uniref:RNA pyrophosphohydrolase n=1 Tax=Zavarzinia compransoris TaxID=1264899 RepID=A0A317E550_9PROT|nr:RNA pyrophosphohydrolase [Zavarzinia compransoris]PWR21702.1 RNA pyrophosphohydrolase [Zavarzinia compransoris]TDP45512.1 putative (di)nucleoside polyphosphate hydrolase [Zavarzinia compransoris]